MTATTSLRPAQDPDIPALQAIARAAYREAVDTLDGMPDVVGSIADDMQGNPAWVVEVEGDVAGFLIAHSAPVALKLINLAIDPDHSGQGLARLLLGEAERLAQSRGLRRMELTTHAGMAATRAMYRHLGWVEDQVTHRVVFLSKPL